jgi:plastocyanin
VRKVLLSLAAITLLAACAEPKATSATSVDLYDGVIEASSTHLQAGDVSIAIENYGQFDHTLVITTADGHVVTATDLIVPGEETTLEVQLPPGRYQFTCRIVSQTPDGQIIDHYQLGMVRSVTVGA